MKFIIIIAITLLVSCSSTSILQKFPLDYTNKRSIAQVMVEVEAKMKAKSPLEAIFNVLSEFRDAVNFEQVSHDEIYHSEVAECDSEKDFRKEQITDATNVLRDSQAQLNSCITQKNRVKNDLEVNEHQSFSTEQHMKLVQHQRDNEESLYKKRQQDYSDALYAIEEAQDILASIFNGSMSFVELSKISKRMLQHGMTISSMSQYAPVLSSFASLARTERSLDDSALERVAQLLDTLKQSIKNSYDDFLTSNANSIESFNQQKERLASNLNRLASQAEKLEHQFEKLSQCIGTQSAISQTASNKLSRNQQLFNQSTALCNTFDNEYNYATQTRREELQLVTELEHLIERRFGQVEDENAARQQRIASLKN